MSGYNIDDDELLNDLYENALESIRHYSSLSEEERREVAMETAEDLLLEMKCNV